MKQWIRRMLLLLLTVGVCFEIASAKPAAAVAESVSDYTLALSHMNTGAVLNGPKKTAGFKLTVASGQVFRLDAISLYHYNSGKGKAPGTITLKKGSTKIGTWKASGNRYKNYYWDVFPHINLAAGSYTITCSSHSTWSYNSGSDNTGFFELYGVFTSKTSGSNLLVNGTAETGDLRGWKASTDKWTATDGTAQGGTLPPYKGSYFFWAEREYSSTTTLYQDVTVKSGQIGKKAVLSSYMAVWEQNPRDVAKLKMSFLNAKGKVIKSYSKSYSVAKWKKHTISKKIPKGTKKIRVQLIGINRNGMTDAYFDNVSLTIK